VSVVYYEESIVDPPATLDCMAVTDELSVSIAAKRYSLVALALSTFCERLWRNVFSRSIISKQLSRDALSHDRSWTLWPRADFSSKTCEPAFERRSVEYGLLDKVVASDFSFCECFKATPEGCLVT
jgi:hypothetical protein